MPRQSRLERMFSWSLPVNTIHDMCGIPLRILNAGIYEDVPTKLPAVKVGRQVLVDYFDFRRWLKSHPKATLEDWAKKIERRIDREGICHDV
jgi:hypothetical protein